MLRFLRSRLRKLRLQHLLTALMVVSVLMVLLNNYAHLPTFQDPPVQSARSKSASLSRSVKEYPLNFQDEECEMCDDSFKMGKDALASQPLVRDLGQEKIQLYRHYTGHQPWPGLQLDPVLPGQLPPTLHYVWCKGEEEVFGFHQYMGLLSAIRLLQPLKVIFHFRYLPRLDHDMYHSWFIELKQSLPNLVPTYLRGNSAACGSKELLETALSFLQQDGGIFLGSNVILSRLPRNLTRRDFWFAFSPTAAGERGADPQGQTDVTRGVIVAKRGFDDATRSAHLDRILAAPGACVAPEVFDAVAPESERSAPCVTFQDRPHIYPVGIMYQNTSFARLARWMFYGTQSPMHPRTDQGDPIPRITHLIWFSPNRRIPYQMEFYQFLTILSALYVGGFHHVYIHGNAGFVGRWWQELAKENVTFVHMEDPQFVYQQAVDNLSHKSDVTRYILLHKYGGAYQDFEAMWTARVPDWLLQYPCVATSDWAAYGDFPDGINPGVLLAKRRAPWLRYNMAAHRYYIEKNFVWNAVLMSYRTYERHPDQLLYYRHLQVMCDFGICHPSWEPGFRRDIDDRRPTLDFDWRNDTLVVHVTRPDPETSFVSPEALKRGTDMFAEIGKNIIQKSGRMDLLP